MFIVHRLAAWQQSAHQDNCTYGSMFDLEVSSVTRLSKPTPRAWKRPRKKVLGQTQGSQLQQHALLYTNTKLGQATSILKLRNFESTNNVVMMATWC